MFSLNLPPLPRVPLAIKAAPIDQAHLNEITHRVEAGMNPEGAAILYPQDVGALLGEVFYLREQAAMALLTLRLLPVSRDLDLAMTAECVAENWEALLQGVWEKDEMQRMKAQVADAEQTLWQERETMREQIAAVKTEQAESLRQQREQMATMRQRVAELEAERRKEQQRLTNVRKLLER